MMAGRGGRRTLAAGFAVCSLLLASAAPAWSETCGRTEFEAVVQEASSVLSGLNQKNKPAMQDRLRQLRDKRGWTAEQFSIEAAAYVRDERTDTLDKRSEELLAKISAMGDAGAGAATAADCKLLADLKAAMQGLVKAQTEKWAHIFAKLDAALSADRTR
jgi:hypothetical protein